LSDDGTHLAILTRKDPKVHIWDSARGRRLPPIKALHAWTSIAIAPDCRTLIALGKDGLEQVEIGTAACTWGPIAEVKKDANGVVRISPDGRQVAVAGEDGRIRLFDTATGAAGAVLAGHNGTVVNLQFSLDGRRLLSCGKDGTAMVWEVPAPRRSARPH
jgi:WD40 repeat protein